METWLVRIADYLLAQSWQIAILTVVVALAVFLLRNRSAHVRYLLWLIVLAKALVPPLYSIPVAVLPQHEPRAYVPSPPIAGIMDDENSVRETVSSPAVSMKPPRYTTRSLLAIGWFVGVVALLSYYLLNALRTQVWLQRQRLALPIESARSIERFFKAHDIARKPRIWLLERTNQPFVWGLVRGSIYLPAKLWHGHLGRDFPHGPEAHATFQASLLVHELCHIIRLDAMVNSLQVIAQAVFWFHPFVWWANAKIRAEREKCCDEMTIARLNARPEEYGEAIVETLAAKYEQARPVPSLAVAGQIKNIEERINTMLRPGKKFYKRPSVAAALVVLFIAFLTIPTALVLTARGQTQSSVQNVTKLNNNEQPHFAARTFNSTVTLEVWVRETSSPMTERRIGRTPSAAPIEIPPCEMWLVRTPGPVEDWDLLAREINQNRVPGLSLGAATDSDLVHLTDLTGLQQLNLAGKRVTDTGLQHLKDLTTLQGLMLANTQITDAGIEQLAGMTGLQRLWLIGCPVTDVGLARLKHLNGLQDLGLLYTQITDAGLVHLKDMTGLRFLYLWGTQFTDAGLEHLKDLTALRHLSLTSAPQVTDAGLAYLTGLNGLQELLLGGDTQITDAGLAHLQHLTRLQRLGLDQTRTTDVGLVYLKDLIQLEELRLRGTLITDAGLAHLYGLTRLRSLDLSNTHVTDAGIQQLKQSLPNLNIVGEQPTTKSNNKPTTDTEKADQPRFAARTFNSKVAFDVWVQDTSSIFSRKQIGRTPSKNPLEISACWLWGVQPLAPVKDWDLLIREVNQNEVPALSLGAMGTDSDIKQVSRLAKLRSLDIARNRNITDAGLGYIKGMSSLQTLTLSGTQLTDAGLEHLKGMTGLVDLYFAHPAFVTDAGLKHLKDLTGLRRLWLQRAQITDTGLEYLKGMTRMEDLMLRETKITGAGIVYLKDMTRLKSLNLTDTQVTDAGMQYLEGMTELESLYLDQTPITDAGLEHLKGVTSLKKLYLSNTKVTNAGLEQIKGLTGLQELVLFGDQITDIGLERLKGMTDLRILALSGNTQITGAGLEHLKGMTRLQWLGLADTGVTDASLENLKTLSGLQVLALQGTQVTDAGVQQLKQSLPNVRIESGRTQSIQNTSDSTDSVGNPAESFDQAAAAGDIEKVKLLISQGVDVNAKIRGHLAIHGAVGGGLREGFEGPIEMVQLLIEKGADVNAKNGLGMIPLHIATRVGRKDIIELLIDKGADVNIKNNAGATPLDTAKLRGQAEIIELLKKHGAKE